MILLIDNYDSFSYNLYQMVGELEPDIRVIRNDEMTVEEVRALKPDRIILSPGPGRPENAGIIVEAAKTVCKEIPTLGVCLGHQAICQAYGGTITYAERLMHGKQSVAMVEPDSPIFRGLPERVPCIAKTDAGEVMAVQHTEYPIYGLQFHPESILTPEGKTILKNFITLS